MSVLKELRPSEVFGARLRDARKHRGLNQAQLAERMTEIGFAVSKTTIVRIERGEGERGLSLDEALAFSACLGASPAHLMTPPPDAVLRLTRRHTSEANGFRQWLRTGTLVRSDLNDDAVQAGKDEFERERDEIVHLAVTLLDAHRGGDPGGTKEALRALVRTVEHYSREASDAS